MRYRLPQPYRDLEHTADVGVEVEGATAEETLARLVLAEAALLTGGAAVAADREERLRAPAGDLRSTAVWVLRELLYRFATERTVAAACEVEALDAGGADVALEVGPFDADRHAEGLDLKAVTWHLAAFERADDGWRARVVFDI